MKAGWEVKPLGEFYEIGSSKRVLKSEWKENGIPFYRAREIVKLAKNGYVENDLFIAAEHFETLVSKYGGPVAGDLMVSAVGTLGACYEVKTADRFYYKDASVLCLHPKKPINSRFVEYAFQTKDVLAQVTAGEGATVGTFTIGRAKATLINLPPLEEQKRIVAILDKAFEGLDRAKQNAQANLQSAKELFETGFEAQLTNSQTDMTKHNFGDLEVLEIIDGDRGKAYPKKTDFQSSGFCLFLSTKNVRSDGFKFDDCQFITEDKDRELRKGKLRRQDVVLTTRGTIGNIGLFDETVSFDKIRINSGMLILRPNEQRLLSEYLFEVLRSRVVLDQIDKETSGAAQPQLPIRTLKELTFSIPKSLDEQANFVSGIRNHQKNCAELLTCYSNKLQDIADLRQSLLQKAFAGELT